MAESDKPVSEVHVVSDGTGETGAAVVKAAMIQFQSPWRLRVFPDVRSESEVRRLVPQAVEFAVRHDDGANLHTLCEADIVLTGVSRTSKTPLSMHLAQRGYKTGNVPLVAGLDPPRELLELDPQKVFGLLIDPAVLLTVRQARLRALRTSPHSSYTDADSIELEIRRARRLYREHGFRSISVTGRAVEENAGRVLELYEANPRIQGPS